MKTWKPGPVIIFLSLIIASLIYFITRTEATLLNHWMVIIAGERTLESIQQIITNSSLPHWVMYSLPDALWMLALTMTIIVIWRYQINRTSIFFVLLATLAGTVHELLQGANVIQGTFDIVDLIFMITAGLLPLAVAGIKIFIYKKQKNSSEESIASEVII